MSDDTLEESGSEPTDLDANDGSEPTDLDASDGSDTDSTEWLEGKGPDPDQAFDEVETTEMDPDEVWESVAGESGDTDIAEVSKHTYCERCEFFSGPPEVECSHEGTEILEFVDMETVKLSNCPIVAERRGLEESIRSADTLDTVEEGE